MSFRTHYEREAERTESKRKTSLIGRGNFEFTKIIVFRKKKVFLNRLKITKLIQKCHIFVTQLTVFFNAIFRYDWSQFPFKASYNQEIEISQTKIQFGEI